MNILAGRNMKIQRIIYIALIFLVLISASVVSAADDSANEFISADEGPEIILEDNVQEDLASANDNELILEENDVAIDDWDFIGSGVENDYLKDSGSPGTFHDLGNLINNTAESYITLNTSYQVTGDEWIGLMDAGIIINRDLTIDGDGNTIDACKKALIFNIVGGNVVFKNIRLVNSNSYYGHGLLYGAIFGNATAINCTFDKDSVAMYSNDPGGSIAINCTFTGNGGTNGGALHNVNAINCTFIGNSADNGGAVFNSTVINCTFIGNHASGQGGAAYNCTAIDCNFINNYVGDTYAGNGGAFSIGSAYNCSFIGNNATGVGSATYNVSAFNCTFINNTCRGGFGGAMMFGTAENCSFINNSALYGDLVMANGTVINSIFKGLSNVNRMFSYSDVINCSFINIQADEQELGDLIYNGNAYNCTFINLQSCSSVFNGSAYNCTFINFTSYFGAINTGNAYGCTFANITNEVGGAIYGGNADGCTFVNISSGRSGGAICGGNAQNSIFINCTAFWYGGAIHGCDSVINCTFIGNYASRQGGAFFANDNLVCDNCTFINNSADERASAFRANGHFKLNNSRFIENFGAGQVIFDLTEKADITISYCLFMNNIGSSIDITNPPAGKGVYSYINNCSFINNSQRVKWFNKVDYNGYISRIFVQDCNFTDHPNGAISFMYANATFSNCSFINNTADKGGAIYLTSGQANDRFFGCTFINNTARNGDGGAIYMDCPVPYYHLKDSIFINNTAIGGNGGALCGASGTYYENGFYGFLSENCIFENNLANDGGAIFLVSGFFDSTNRLEGNVFTNNTARNNGGAIYFDITDVTLNVYSCSFSDNIAYENGGAIFKSSLGNFNIGGDVFTHNIAENGGAIHWEGDNSIRNIFECDFIDNQANANGGAINFVGENTTGDIHDSLFINNSANKGGAILFSSKDSSIYKCVFIDNSINDESGEAVAIYYCGENSQIVDNIFLDDGIEVSFLNDEGPEVLFSWFGNNATNFNIKPQSENLESWFFINAIINPKTADTYDIIFKLLLYNSSSNIISECDNSQLKDIDLRISSTNGNVDKESIKFGDMIEFISDGENIGVVTAEYGNAIYTINVLPIPQFDIASIFDNNASTIRFVVNGIDNGNPFNGDVCVSVDGKDYLFSIVNGTAISDVINDIAHPAIYNAKIIFYGDENHQLISMGDEELEVIGNSLSDLAYIIAKNIGADIYELSLDRDFSYDPNTDSPEGILLDNELIGEDKTFTLHGNGHTIDGIGQSRIFYLNNTNLVLDGISVINANSSAGGAIYSENSTLTISNSIFKNNNASDGGVIFADKSSSLAITGSLFEDNTAHNGAVINSKGLVTMDASNFTNNSAHNGGVIYADSGSITVNNSLFSENSANAQGGVIYNRGQLKVFDSIFSLNYGSQGGAIFNGKYANVDNSTFTENKAGYNGAAIYSENEVNVSDSTFKDNGGNKAIHSDYGNIESSKFIDGDNVSGRITVSPDCQFLTTPVFEFTAILDFISGSSVDINISESHGLNGTVTVRIGELDYLIDIVEGIGRETVNPVLIAGNYSAVLTFAGDENFTDASAESDKFHVFNVPEFNIGNISDFVTGSFVTLNISAIERFNGLVNIVISGKSYAVNLVNGSGSNTVALNLPAGSYKATINFSGNEDFTPENVSSNAFTVMQKNTAITASAVTTIYNVNKNLLATLKDNDGKAISGLNVTIKINGKTYACTTDKNGQVKLAVGSLVPKSYTAAITFAGNGIYAKATKSVKVTVKKASPKLIAKKKTFKLKVKVKKYFISLKTNKNKGMKGIKLTLRVKGKKFKAKTNKKGVAIFKITNLKKRGKHTAVIKYAGNKYYKKVNKKVRITVKK